jgi:hypothetical protein
VARLAAAGLVDLADDFPPVTNFIFRQDGRSPRMKLQNCARAGKGGSCSHAPRTLQVRVKQFCFAREMEDDKAAALIHLFHDDFRPFIEADDVVSLVKLRRLLVLFAHLSHVVMRLDGLYRNGGLFAGGNYSRTREREQTSRCLCRRNGGRSE